MSLFLAVMSVGFTACSSDDDDNGIENPDDILQNGKWVEEGNTITYTTNVGSLYTMKWVLTFDANDICTKSVCESTFANSAMANEYFNEQKDEGHPINVSGNKVTEDFTQEHKGLSKSVLKAAIEAMSSGQGFI